MSLTDTIASRRAKAKTADDATPVATAIATPLPDGIDAAMAKADTARASMDRAQEARDAFASYDLHERHRAARVKLDRLQVRAEIAGPLGEDAPGAEEIAAAQADFDAAESALGARDMRLDAYDEAVEARRATYEAAHSELTVFLVPWRAAVREAADKQLANAAHLAGEAQAALYVAEPWRTPPVPVSYPRAEDEGEHRGPENVKLPESVAKIIEDWRRHWWRLLRT